MESCNYLNLLTITAMISRTRTVIIAIVTILLVAILSKIGQHTSFPALSRPITKDLEDTFAPCP